MLNALHTGGGMLITVMFIYCRYRSAVDSVHQRTVHTRTYIVRISLGARSPD